MWQEIFNLFIHYMVWCVKHAGRPKQLKSCWHSVHFEDNALKWAVSCRITKIEKRNLPEKSVEYKGAYTFRVIFCYTKCKKWQMFFSNLWIMFGMFPACAADWSYRCSGCSSNILCTHINNCDVQEDCVVIHINSNYRMRHILFNLKVLS